jgi:hypothetical protein
MLLVISTGEHITPVTKELNAFQAVVAPELRFKLLATKKLTGQTLTSPLSLYAPVEGTSADAIEAWTRAAGAGCRFEGDVAEPQTYMSLGSWKAVRAQTVKPALPELTRQPSTTLAQLKAKRCSDVDARTHGLIAGGFPFDSAIFSASDNAQRNWQGLYLERTTRSYPVLLSTKANDAVIALADEAAVVAFYGAALAHVTGHLTAGTLLKQQILARTTTSAVEAIADDRT